MLKELGQTRCPRGRDFVLNASLRFRGLPTTRVSLGWTRRRLQVPGGSALPLLTNLGSDWTLPTSGESDKGFSNASRSSSFPGTQSLTVRAIGRFEQA